MASLRVKILTGKSKETLKRDYELSDSAKYVAVQGVADLLMSILSGNQTGDGSHPPTVEVSTLEDATFASGTFTLLNVIATDLVTINGVSFTCVANGATGNQFNVGLNDTATAVNLAAAIAASVTALVKDVVTATSNSTVVTVTSLIPGLAGNDVTIATPDSTITPSGARLTGGAEDATTKTYTF